MKKVIFGVIFAFLVSAGVSTFASADNNVIFELVSKDKDKDKKKKKKKNCCASKGEAETKKACCDKDKKDSKASAGKEEKKSCAGKEEKKPCGDHAH